MPIQTYRGCLEGIIPSNATEWDFEANQHFWDITKCQTLYAAITDVDTVVTSHLSISFEITANTFGFSNKFLETNLLHASF